jgi:cytochrome c biogenesis protein CcmG/thiol:disulfide interchange protein DsbE
VDERLTDLEASATAQPPSRWLRTLRPLAVAFVLALLVILVLQLRSANSGGRFVASISAGKAPPAPAFRLAVLWREAPTWPPAALPLLAVDRLALRSLRGRPVVINFWASWCVPCRDEAPVLEAGARAYAGKVVFLGVDVQDLSGEARHFARKYGMNYGSLTDRSNQAYNNYGLTGVPETYYVDARGRVIAHNPGPVTRTTLAQGIRLISPRSKPHLHR